MKKITAWFWLFSFGALFMLHSCGGKTNSPTDSGTATKDSIHSSTGNDSGKTATGLGDSLPTYLRGRTDLFCYHVFTESFQRKDLEGIDITEHFSGEIESDFRRFISMKEVKNSTGRGIFPRAIIMATRFPDFATLKQNLETWIQLKKKEEPKVELGVPIKGVKSSPFVAAVIGNDVFILKSSCAYSSPDWEKQKENFIGLAKSYPSQYLFQVTCEEKNLDYLK